VNKLQFRVLYRQFLFRLVDLEWLSTQADTSKLLGQFAAMLVFFSLCIALGSMFFDVRSLPPDQMLARIWGIEHFLLATTMLVVGLFAVLCWDSIFPNQRDVMVLAPLPVQPRTVFLANSCAVATGLATAVLALNGLSGFAWPLALGAHNGLGGSIRLLAGYWITTLSAGLFIFCSVLSLQALASQLLPRRIFLRISALLQTAAFCLFLCLYFLEPPLATPAALAAPQNQSLLHWLPSYWFLGLLQTVGGSPHPALAPLTWRALVGVAISFSSAAVAFLLSYFRTMKKIAEEPDIMPGPHRMHWSMDLGDSIAGAVALFSIRTLLRSRRHRAILCFYLGVGLFIVLLTKNPIAQDALLRAAQGLSFASMIASIAMMCLTLLGLRVAFSMPLDLKANWIFRTTPVKSISACVSGSRRALLLLGVTPICAITAGLLLTWWPWRLVIGHLAVLAVLGLILTELCLLRFHKIPFTCSYLPGKANIYLAFYAAVALGVPLSSYLILLERRLLLRPPGAALMLTCLAVAAGSARWFTAQLVKSSAAVSFEEEPVPVILSLGLHRDGIMPVGKTS